MSQQPRESTTFHAITGQREAGRVEYGNPFAKKMYLVVDSVPEMQRAMAQQAEAERERRAKIISSEGEFQAADRLADAAAIIGKHPEALQLRYLQTLREISSEGNNTILPIPLDLLRALTGDTKK